MQPSGRIAAVLIPPAVREGIAVFLPVETHARGSMNARTSAFANSDTLFEAALRSLLLGNLLFLKLTRLVRPCLSARGTADDAVLTLAILDTQTCLIRAAALPRAPNLLHGLIDEAAEPHIHHKANRHEYEQRGRTPVAHER
jgi:hypothetical protein